MKNKKWYDNKILTNILVFTIFPVGLYGIWKSEEYAKWWKVLSTVIVVILFAVELSDSMTVNNKTQLNKEEIESFEMHSENEVLLKPKISTEDLENELKTYVLLLDPQKDNHDQTIEIDFVDSKFVYINLFFHVPFSKDKAKEIADGLIRQSIFYFDPKVNLSKNIGESYFTYEIIVYDQYETPIYKAKKASKGKELIFN